MTSEKNFWQNIGFIFYFIPILILIIVVARFSVNLPLMEQWLLVPFFEKVARGETNFGDWFTQYNQNRLLFPQLIFTTLAFISRWDIKYELGFNIFLASLTYFGLYKIASRTQGNLVDVAHILTSIFIFSLVQWQNWLWGWQLSTFLVNTCLVFAVLILTGASKLSGKIRLAIAAILCFIASFSTSQGLLTWLAVIPAIVLVDDQTTATKKKKLTWWLGTFLLTLIIYFIGYKIPANLNIWAGIKDPFSSLIYFLALLGSPLLSLGKSYGEAAFFGFIILLTLVNITLYFHRNFRSKFSHLLPWICLGLFSLVFSLLTTLFRGDVDLSQVMDSKYTTNNIFLLVAFVQISRLFIGLYPDKRIVVAKSFYIFFATIITTIVVANSWLTITYIKNDQLTREAGKNCLEIVNLFTENPDESLQNSFKNIMPAPEKFKQNATILKKLKFHKFLSKIELIDNPPQGHGFLDINVSHQKVLVVENNNKPIPLGGWAVLPDNPHNPNLVVFSDHDNKPFFAIALITLDRPDVAKALGSNRFTKSGWGVSVLPKYLPKGESTIKAWVYDQDHHNFVKLVDEQKVVIK